MNPSRASKYETPRTKRHKSKKLPFAIGLLIIITIVIAVVYIFSMNNSEVTNSSAIKVQLQTSMGDITIELRDDRPITTNNFRNLVQQGLYDDTIFHRVIADFMIQGGDPTGTGYGDPSIPKIQDELEGDNKNNRGTISMANTGQPNTGSSQFFINVVDNNHLDAKHSVFGSVVLGMDVVDAISNVSTDSSDKPLIDVTIVRAEIMS